MPESVLMPAPLSNSTLLCWRRKSSSCRLLLLMPDVPALAMLFDDMLFTTETPDNTTTRGGTMTSAHLSCRKPGTALFLLLLISTSHAQNAARWLYPALDEQNLPRNGSILFWSGDQQIAGFRNIAKVSA